MKTNPKYDRIGLDKYGRVSDTPIQQGTHMLALQQDFTMEYKPLTQPVMITKKQIHTTAGGSVVMWDKTQGTKLFMYDPTTGVVTINGSLVAQHSNTGTYTNITLAGNNPVIGTMQNGVYGTAQITGGTVGTAQLTGGTLNPDVYQTSGSAGATGSVVYVKTVSPGTTFGTINFANGLILSFS